MIYRCPLCLRRIESGMQVIRYCVPHENAETITFDEDMLTDNRFSNSLFCQEPGCEANDVPGGIVDGVFLSHVGCEAVNPFWKGERVEIPTDLTGRNDGNSVKIGDMVIEHWEIAVLREIRKSSYPGEEYQHMWFPLMLFRALARPENARGTGSIVALIGEQNVGKTILAMQAMDKQGYLRTGANGRNVNVRDYVFSRPESGVTETENPWFETLYLRHLLYEDKPNLFRPAGNQRVAGDLKTVFIEPVVSAVATSGSSQRTGNSHFRNTGLKSSGRSLVKVASGLKSLARLIGDFVTVATTFGPAERSPDRATQLPWYTVMFYDSAGEGSRLNDSIIRSILRCADKRAILVSAPEIFQAGVEEKTIRVAHARLDDLRGQRATQNLCLVVTQLDKVLRRIGDDADKIRRIAENLDDRPQEQRKSELEEARALLRSWLNKSGYATVKKSDFARDLAQFEEIFFLWTENLPPQDPSEFKVWLEEKRKKEVSEVEPLEVSDATSAQETPPDGATQNRKTRRARQRASTQPESYGLAKFICWCLDISWKDINNAG